MMDKNYESLPEITVKTQAELDAIPLDYKGRIYIEFGTFYSKAIIKNRYHYPVVARGNSSVEARENSYVVAWENSSVAARGNSYVVARGNSYVAARENSYVEAWGNSSVVARGNSYVVARNKSDVEARENSYVEAWDKSSVAAWGNSSVVAWDKSSVVARGNSYVEARENSYVEAWGNSSVEAWGNSYVVAWGNSYVAARGNVQVVRLSKSAKISTFGNAREVCNPETIHGFMSFHNIEHDEKKAIFYKAVHKKGNVFHAHYDYSFEYKIGETVEEKVNEDVRYNCGMGIHISHLGWVLDFAREWRDAAILEVETNISDIVLPENSDGKVRTSRVRVLREVPLSECGVYGRILERRIGQTESEGSRL